MSNGVKAKIIPRIVMSITPLDVMLLPGTHTRESLSVYKCVFLFTFLYISYRSFRRVFGSCDDDGDVYNYACRRRRRRPVRSGDRRCARIVYNNIQDNWCAHAYWRSIKASGAAVCAGDCLVDKFIVNAFQWGPVAAAAAVATRCQPIIYYAAHSLLHWWWLFSRHHHLFSYYCRMRATL